MGGRAQTVGQPTLSLPTSPCACTSGGACLFSQDTTLLVNKRRLLRAPPSPLLRRVTPPLLEKKKKRKREEGWWLTEKKFQERYYSWEFVEEGRRPLPSAPSSIAVQRFVPSGGRERACVLRRHDPELSLALHYPYYRSTSPRLLLPERLQRQEETGG